MLIFIVKALAKKNKKSLLNPLNAFKYNEEILHYLPASIEFDKKGFDVHIFFNEKSEIQQKHNFLSPLLEIEAKLRGKKFNTLKEYLNFKKSNIPEKYVEYFKWNKTTLEIEKNAKKIKSYVSKMGSILILTNIGGMDKEEVLSNYRQRDCVEKIFNVVKNEIDGDRCRE